MLEKYAKLIVEYCLEIKSGDRLLIRTTTLAEPLVKEIYKQCMLAGGHPHINMEFAEKTDIYWETAQEHHLSYIDPLQKLAFEEFEAYLYIKAPSNLMEGNQISNSKKKHRAQFTKPIQEVYFQRTATKALKRSLCLFPTQASAQFAGMNLSQYQDFVYQACHLYDDRPMSSWLEIRKNQQQIVDYLNQAKQIRYVNAKSDITFSTKERIWINSDGQTNMPSGEVYTSPVEDSVNGHIYFDLPTVYNGKRVSGVTLYVKDGWIERWEAEEGQDFLDEIFQIEGTRRFGEAAIGTNYNIQQTTGNILFDEKIGGTVHLAIGQSYLQTGGKNQSSVHWDMIADMRQGGEIYADTQRIYENGTFIL